MKQSPVLNILLWVVQGLLALAFLFAGFFKLATPMEELATNMPWVTETPSWLVRFIGLAEVAGAIGLIVPAATRIKPNLTPMAALGIIAIMVLAAIFHLTREGEAPMVLNNVFMIALAGFVYYGRTKLRPIAPK
ncbi:MAG: DoxX family protein [Bacteroidota bacterium]